MRIRNLKNRIVLGAMMVLSFAPALYSQSTPTVFASGFNNPRGLKFRGRTGTFMLPKGAPEGRPPLREYARKFPPPVGPYTGESRQEF